MLRSRTKKRLALTLGVAGVGLMGIDLMITGSPFIHTAEMMFASIACFCIALIVDARADSPKATEKSTSQF